MPRDIQNAVLQTRDGRATRLLHACWAVTVVAQLFTSLQMHGPDIVQAGDAPVDNLVLWEVRNEDVLIRCRALEPECLSCDQRRSASTGFCHCDCQNAGKLGDLSCYDFIDTCMGSARQARKICAA